MPSDLISNLDQTPLSYLSPGKYNVAKNVSIKGAKDKRQAAATFVVSATGNFLPNSATLVTVTVVTVSL